MNVQESLKFLDWRAIARKIKNRLLGPKGVDLWPIVSGWAFLDRRRLVF